MKRLVLAAALAAGPAAAWEATVVPEASVPMAWTFATRTPSGDIRLSDDDGLQWDSGLGFQFARYPLPRRWSVAAPHASGRGMQVTSFELQDYLPLPRFERPCQLQRNLFGDDQRSVGRNLETGFAYVLKRGSAEGDESNVVGLETFAFPNPTRVVRVRNDCSAEALATVPGTLYAAAAIPGTREALVLHHTAVGEALVSRVAADGVRWTRPLARHGGTVPTAYSVVTFQDGDYAVRGWYDQAYHVLRYAADGSLWAESRFEGRVNEIAAYEGLLLVHQTRFPADAAPYDLLTAFDASGRERTLRFDGNEFLEAAPRALEPYRFDKTSPPLDRAMVLLTAPPGQDAPQRPYEFRGLDDLTAYATLAEGERALAQASVGGDLLIREGDGLAIVSRRGSRQRVGIEIPRVGPPATQLALHADAEGTALVVAFGDAPPRLQWRDAQGALRWQRALPGGRTAAGLASNAQRLCLAHAGDDVALHCFTKHDGREVFPATRVAGTGEAVAGLHVDDAGRVTFVTVPPPCPDDCASAASLLRVSPDGEVATLATRPAHNVVADAALGLFALESRHLGQRSVEVLARDGTLTASYAGDVGVVGTLVAVGPGGRVLSKVSEGYLGPHVFRQQSPGDADNWRDAARSAWCRPPQARALGGDWLVWGFIGEEQPGFGAFCYGVRTMLIDGSDGSVRWSDEQTQGLDLRSVQILSHPARGEFVRVIEQGDGSARERRAERVSLAGGQRLDAPRVAHSVAGHGVEALAADGTLASAAFSREGALLSQVALQRTPPPAPPADARQRALRGAWAARDTAGQGLFLDVLDGRVYGGWFTYRAAGGHHGEGHRWYLLVETGESAAPTLAIQQVEAARFLGTGGVARRIGTATLVLHDCDHASLVYDFAHGEHAGLRGAIPLDRAAPAGVACGAPEAPGATSRLGGAWSIEGADGQGFVLDRRGEKLEGASFTHDVATATPRWFTLVGRETPGNDAIALTVLRTLGGSLDGEATNNTWTVAEATLVFETCDRARLDYRFVPGEEAHAFAGRSGTLTLRRSGGCSP